MRAITWTQVAQYVVILLAFMLPVSWLAYKQLGNPLAPVVYTQQLSKIAAMEQQLLASEAEQSVLDAYRTRAQVLQAKLRDVPNVLAAERQALAEHIRELRTSSGNIGAIMAASRELASMPRDEATARERWTRELREAYERAKPLGDTAAEPALRRRSAWHARGAAGL